MEKINNFTIKSEELQLNDRRLRRRSRYEIIVDILRTARHGERKTRIMSVTKLSYAQLKYYLDLLNQGGFLENCKGFYTTTLKGHQFIKDFETIDVFSF